MSTTEPIDYGFVRVRWSIVTPGAARAWLRVEAVDSWPDALMPSYAILQIAPLGFLTDLSAP